SIGRGGRDAPARHRHPSDAGTDPADSELLSAGSPGFGRARLRPRPPPVSQQGDRDRLMPTALTNARVLTRDGWRDDAVVVVEGGRIAAVGADKAVAGEVVDLKGRLLVPGFIDTQVNGGGDVLFNECPTAECIARIGAAHRRFRTTGYLPTPT